MKSRELSSWQRRSLGLLGLLGLVEPSVLLPLKAVSALIVLNLVVSFNHHFLPGPCRVIVLVFKVVAVVYLIMVTVAGGGLERCFGI